jgi:hypothetical protein
MELNKKVGVFSKFKTQREFKEWWLSEIEELRYHTFVDDF